MYCLNILPCQLSKMQIEYFHMINLLIDMFPICLSIRKLFTNTIFKEVINTIIFTLGLRTTIIKVGIIFNRNFQVKFMVPIR